MGFCQCLRKTGDLAKGLGSISQCTENRGVFAIQGTVGILYGAEDLLAVLKHRDTFLQGLVLSFGKGGALDLLCLESKEVCFPGILCLGLQQVTKTFSLVLIGVIGLQEGGSAGADLLAPVLIHNAEMLQRIQKQLIVVLSVDIRQPVSDLVDLAQRYQLSVQTTEILSVS